MIETTPHTDRACERNIAPILALALLAAFFHSSAAAGILPLLNGSVAVSYSRVQGEHGPIDQTKVDIAPPNPMTPWNGQAFSSVSESPNSAFGLMTISYVVNETGMRIFTGGAANAFGEAMNKGRVGVNVFFQVITPQDANFAVTLSYGGANTLAGSATALLFPWDVRNQPYRTLGTAPGQTITAGRLAPGLYLVVASAEYDSTSQSGGSPSFSLDAGFTDVTNPLVTNQPTAQATPQGQTTNFNVTATGTLATAADFAPASTTTASTYQWRRNLVNLTNGGRISGATTNHLVISNTAYADTGFYDVIVANGTTVEPSSLARLTVIAANAGVGPSATIDGVEMSLPQPNPTYGRTSVRFALPSSMLAGLDVLDVSGRVVKSLVSYGIYEPGARSAEWEGSDAAGRHVAPGIYFLRLRAGTSQVVRRVAILGAN